MAGSTQAIVDQLAAERMLGVLPESARLLCDREETFADELAAAFRRAGREVLRALARNQERIADLGELETLYRSKYIRGFEIYTREVAPERRASFVTYPDSPRTNL